MEGVENRGFPATPGIDFRPALVYPPQSLPKCLFSLGNKCLPRKYSISNKTAVGLIVNAHM